MYLCVHSYTITVIPSSEKNYQIVKEVASYYFRKLVCILYLQNDVRVVFFCFYRCQVIMNRYR
jgi:hypothetical protein